MLKQLNKVGFLHVILLNVLIVGILIFPNVGGYRTFACNGDGEGYSDLKKATDTCCSRLGNEWQWTTDNLNTLTYGTWNDKALTEKAAIRNIFGIQQSQVIIFTGHAAHSQLALKGDDVLYYNEATRDTAQGNWGDSLPGTVFMLGACYVGANVGDGFCANYRDGGARVTQGEIGKYKLKFGAEWSTDYAKYIIHDTGYNLDQCFDKSFDEAYDDLWWLWLFGADEPDAHIYYWTENSAGDYDTLHHIPRFEYDFDAGGFGIMQSGSWEVGGDSGVGSDNGAILFLNGEIEDPDPPDTYPGGELGSDYIQVEYKTDLSSDDWISVGCFQVKKDTNHAGYDTQSEDIIYWFKDDWINDGKIKVKITPLEGGFSIHNMRLHVFAE